MTQEANLSVPNRGKLVVASLAGFLAAYIFGSLAFDRGSYWYYGLTLAGLYFGVRNLWRSFKATKKGHE